MEEFPANNDKQERAAAKNDRKKIDPVVVGRIQRRKKPLGKRFVETFAGGEDARSVWGYILLDVLQPAAKDMIADASREAVERMLFGDSRGSSRRGRSTGYVSYGNRYQSPLAGNRRDEPRPISRRARAKHDFDEIVLETRVEAEEVIDQLFELISRYEVASVADLYELCNISGNFTDEKWGWTDMRGANVSRVRNGYLLNLPRPEPLD